MEARSEIPGVYHSFESVLSVLNSEKYADLSEVKALLSIYDSFKLKEKEVATGREKKKPFIVMEGLDGCGKSTITKLLAKKVRGELKSTPPSCIRELRENFDSHPQELRRAYYALGNYIAALEVSLITVDKPVVMDRFWHSTAAYAIANAATDGTSDVPAEGDPIYLWPADLLKPDMVFFLEVEERVRLGRLRNRKEYTKEEDNLKRNNNFRDKLILAYKTMREPNLNIINANLAPNKVIREVLAAVNESK